MRNQQWTHSLELHSNQIAPKVHSFANTSRLVTNCKISSIVYAIVIVPKSICALASKAFKSFASNHRCVTNFAKLYETLCGTFWIAPQCHSRGCTVVTKLGDKMVWNSTAQPPTLSNTTLWTTYVDHAFIGSVVLPHIHTSTQMVFNWFPIHLYWMHVSIGPNVHSQPIWMALGILIGAQEF